MPSRTFYCPHCNTQLIKTEQQYLMGGKKTAFVIMGESGPYVYCPNCRGSIEKVKIIACEYDRDSKKNRFVSLVLDVIFLGSAILAGWVLHEKLHWGWVLTIFGGVLIGLGIMQIFSRMLPSSKKGVTSRRNKLVK